MTIVEFFDDEAIDNAIGTILLRPERTVFLYADAFNEAFVAVLRRILRKRGIKCEIIAERVDISSIESAKRTIECIVEKYPDCDFDIAGGSDIMLVAIGETAKKYSLPLHSVNVKKRSVNAVNGSTKYTVYDTFLSVEELIGLYGGKIGHDAREAATYRWKKNAGVLEDTEKVWNICRGDPSAWNSAIGAMKGYRNDKGAIASVWAKLKRDRLIRGEKTSVIYKNTLVKYLLSRQGTALEMHTYMAAKEADFFDDGQSGVLIDWKGKREIENEIDVLLTRGAVGYFISCKNGMTDSNELYKLSTVATRFGGRYAKKILVVTYFTPDASFMERAKELGIKVIKDVRHLAMKDFVKRITDE